MVRPNSFSCPICGFCFDTWQKWDHQLGVYFEKTKKKPPKFLQQQIKEFKDKKLYKSIYKKFGCALL